MSDALNIERKRNDESSAPDALTSWTTERMLAAEPVGPRILSYEEFEKLTEFAPRIRIF